MVIKTKPRGRVEVEEVFGEAYQVSEPLPSRIVVDTEILSSLRFTWDEIEIVEPSTQRLIRAIDGTKLDGSIDYEEDEFEDNIDFESDEDSPQLSD